MTISIVISVQFSKKRLRIPLDLARSGEREKRRIEFHKSKIHANKGGTLFLTTDGVKTVRALHGVSGKRIQ